VNTKRLVRTLAACRCPVVNVAAVFHGLRFPRVGVDNVQSEVAQAAFQEMRHRDAADLCRRA
jgi:hypothetical protein